MRHAGAGAVQIAVDAGVRFGFGTDLLLVDRNPLTNLEVLGGQGDHLELIVRSGEIIVNRVT